MVTSVKERYSKYTHYFQRMNKLYKFYFTKMMKFPTLLVPSLECTKCVSITDVYDFQIHPLNLTLPCGIVVQTLSNSKFMLYIHYFIAQLYTMQYTATKVWANVIVMHLQQLQLGSSTPWETLAPGIDPSLVSVGV